jgi:hypothetical protein
MQFAWQDFTALNWPALAVNPNNKTQIARGLPNTSQQIGGTSNGDNPTVWEQYQPNWYLFAYNNPPAPASGGNSFAAWNEWGQLPSSCGPLQGSGPPIKILSQLSKFDAQPGLPQAFSSPLIDQSGYYARYDIQMNYPAFNYINANQYYLASAQAKQSSFSFPVQQGSTAGAIFIKSAWKVLQPAEINSGRFHTAQAFLYTPNNSQVQQTCVGPVTVGLVGLHIVQKTANFPDFMWATFEQVDNTPADPSNPPPPPPAGWSFFKPPWQQTTNPPTPPNCPTPLVNGNCNDWQPTSSHIGDATGGPTQDYRLNPIPNSQNQPALGQANTSAQAALKAVNSKSVWQYYQLVDAQWQNAGTCTGFFPPSGVSNMTLETFDQVAGQTCPNATNGSSCLQCHIGATAANGTTPADTTFELSLGWTPPAPLPSSRVPKMRKGH